MTARSALHDGCFAPPQLHHWDGSKNDLGTIVTGELSALGSPVSCVEEFPTFYRVHFKYRSWPSKDIDRETFLQMWRDARPTEREGE